MSDQSAINMLRFQLQSMQHIQEKCFEENDELRQRVMELEINYGMAQDDIEKRDNAIKEMDATITQLNKDILLLQKKILKKKKKKFTPTISRKQKQTQKIPPEKSDI